ncbi:hypothetical protein EX30DRAFT_67419 [Ascodesmis nigricans]|uniref:Uncharacterized protein n=1 Tax=Ascodesmis nigricans TaxID=341454 RepID=A0A4S2MU36_9PEZI|nr:hypothetical protein EX30DRAFT_67419 [Ascodesmis nigricans]
MTIPSTDRSIPHPFTMLHPSSLSLSLSLSLLFPFSASATQHFPNRLYASLHSSIARRINPAKQSGGSIAIRKHQTSDNPPHILCSTVVPHLTSSSPTTHHISFPADIHPSSRVGVNSPYPQVIFHDTRYTVISPPTQQNKNTIQHLLLSLILTCSSKRQ